MAIGEDIVAASAINTELGRASSSLLSIDTAESGGYSTIKTCGGSFPNTTQPAAYSEWRNYNHSFACCVAPVITAGTAGTNSLSVNVTLSNCTTMYTEYSFNGGGTWTTSTGSCASTSLISGLTSSTTYLIRVRITCTSTGGFSAYSNTVSMTTTGGYPAYGTYLSQFCTGCTLYYRYANGTGGTYDVSQGCSTNCGGCCCSDPYGTYLYDGCIQCDNFQFFSDGCYGTYTQLIEANSTACGCGGGPTCYYVFSDGTGPINYTDCDGNPVFTNNGKYGEPIGCCDIQYAYYGVYHEQQPCDGNNPPQ